MNSFVHGYFQHVRLGCRGWLRFPLSWYLYLLLFKDKRKSLAECCVWKHGHQILPFPSWCPTVVWPTVDPGQPIHLTLWLKTSVDDCLRFPKRWPNGMTDLVCASTATMEECQSLIWPISLPQLSILLLERPHLVFPSSNRPSLWQWRE